MTTTETFKPLAVRPTGPTGQFHITRDDDDRLPPAMEWSHYYVDFSGYFGSFGPHVFAAAPDMLAVLNRILTEEQAPGLFAASMPHDMREQVRAAISKATAV